MSSEVTELINALKQGSITISEVAQRFRERAWPSTREPKPQTYLQRAVAAEDDPDPLVPGSFDEVAAAYHRGDISIDDYRTLAEAAADSMRADMNKRIDE
jgi:hypothetical protein